MPAAPSETAPDPTKAPASSAYRIGPGDVLQIDIWKEPEVSVPMATVRSDGVITFPMLKEVVVAGMTPHDLETLLTEKLTKYIKDPDVAVTVREVHSEKAYVVGAVRKEGPILLHSPLTVLQAIAETGGLTEFAKRSKIYILRLEGSKQTRIPFDYSAVIKGQRTESNILLRSGDTVVVPE